MHLGRWDPDVEVFLTIDLLVVKNDRHGLRIAGMKNVMIITSTVPYLGVTKDDGREKPALYKEYDFG
jgi:hypothetical protein